MTHQAAMARRNEPAKRDPDPNCETELQHRTGGFWDDVSWEIYYCPRCDVYLSCVGGGAHHWNYVISEASRERLFGGVA